MQKRNNSIDIFRLICSIMVIMIHVSPFIEINESIGFFFSTIFPRIAVPFFFAVSGYFYHKKLEKSKHIYQTLFKELSL